MITYLMGEITTLLVISVLAGMLIGWCIKSLLASHRERQVRTYVARDVDDAMADVDSLRNKLRRKDDELAAVHQELQKMRGRDMSMKAGNTTQIEEINKLKNELAIARQSLDRNRTEFNSFRNDSQKEVQTLNNQIARFTAGGPVYDERMTEANETISALRNAARENDRVIESLRARIKEGDTTVESLRSQLSAKESSFGEMVVARQSAEETVTKLNASLTETTTERDQLRRDYDITLANKNGEISKLHTRVEELGKAQTELKQTELEVEKLRRQMHENADRAKQQIADLKQSISTKEAERASYLKDQKRMQQEVADLQTEQSRLKATSENNLQRAQVQLAKLQDELTIARDKQTTAQREMQSADALKTQIENKSAEVAALNDMLRDVSSKRSQLQGQVTSLQSKLQQSDQQRGEQQQARQKIADLTNALHERDATIAKLKSDFDEVMHSRNQLGIEIGHLQSTNEQARAAIKAESDTQLSQLASTLKDRDQSFAKLRNDMDQMTVSRDRLTAELQKLQSRGAELESFKSDMQKAVANRDSELQQRASAYKQLQLEFDNLSKLRDDYELRIQKLKTEVDQQSQRLKDQEARNRKEIDSLRPQIADLRSRLSLADNENLKLNAELSSAAALQLSSSEKDSVIQKLQIELQDAKIQGAGVDQNSLSKIDSLTQALRDRDEEISRLNSSMTDNRLASKQSQSEITLLKQEIDAQAKLIKGLEEQSENSLTLHKKIAAQSTEIEELRARLYQGNMPSSSTANNEELDELRRQLQQKSSAYDALQRQHALLQQNPDTQSTTPVSTKPADQPNTTSTQTKKATPVPATVVRAESKVSTDSLTGVSASVTPTRVAYTRDGYRIKHPDGRDNLTLLPGISTQAEQSLNKSGISDFEEIVLWGNREIHHFAERIGIAPTKAAGFNWPQLAGEILKGSYRADQHAERDNH